MVYFVTTESLETFSLRMQLIGIADPSFWTRFGVSYGLFLGALRSGATPNQMSECDSDIDWSFADRASSLLPYRFTRCLRSDLLSARLDLAARCSSLPFAINGALVSHPALTVRPHSPSHPTTPGRAILTLLYFHLTSPSSPAFIPSARCVTHPQYRLLGRQRRTRPQRRDRLFRNDRAGARFKRRRARDDRDVRPRVRRVRHPHAAPGCNEVVDRRSGEYGDARCGLCSDDREWEEAGCEDVCDAVEGHQVSLSSVRLAAYRVPSHCATGLTARTFALLPGITIGDIGKKMGRDGIGELTRSEGRSQADVR